MFSENVATIDIQDLTRDFCIVLAPYPGIANNKWC